MTFTWLQIVLKILFYAQMKTTKHDFNLWKIA